MVPGTSLKGGRHAMISAMLSGAFAALVTPFDERYEVDYPALARLLAWHEAEGMNGIVIGGTNGEGPSLSAIEKRDMVRFAVEHGGGLQVIAGLGTSSITEALWLSEQARKAGAMASLVLPPHYFRGASESGIETWFSILLDGSQLPCVFYNIPRMTGITLSPAMLNRLFRRFGHAVGIKDSSGDELQLSEYLKLGRPVLVGDETLLLKSLRSGGAGTISGLANSHPSLIARQTAELSDALQDLIDEACAFLKAFPQPAVHKAVLAHKGLPGGTVRPPLEPLSPDADALVGAYVARFGF